MSTSIKLFHFFNCPLTMPAEYLTTDTANVLIALMVLAALGLVFFKLLRIRELYSLISLAFISARSGERRSRLQVNPISLNVQIDKFTDASLRNKIKGETHG